MIDNDKNEVLIVNFGVKDFNVKTLVTGDKQARLVLETLDPRDIPKLHFLLDMIEVTVGIHKETLDDLPEII